jgi:hypothetical protein
MRGFDNDLERGLVLLLRGIEKGPLGLDVLTDIAREDLLDHWNEIFQQLNRGKLRRRAKYSAGGGDYQRIFDGGAKGMPRSSSCTATRRSGWRRAIQKHALPFRLILH